MTTSTPRSALLASLLTQVVLLTPTGCKSDRASTNGNASTRAASTQTSPPTDARVEWSDPVIVARGPAVAGPWRMNDSQFHYVDDPTVDFGSDETLGVAWVDNQRQQIFFRRFETDGNPLSDRPARVSSSPETFSWLPSLVVDRGDVFILWQEIVFSGGSHGGEAFFARSVDRATGFSDPVNLSNSKAGDGKGRLTEEHWDNGSLDLAVGPGGDLYAAWTEYEGRLWLRRSSDRGETFSEPVHVGGTAGAPARGPALAVTPDGTAYLAWTVGGSDTADIRLARSTDGSLQFEDPRIPFATEGHSDAPTLASDTDGTLHLAWAESDEGRFGEDRIRYARDVAGTEPAVETVAGPQTPRHASADYPALATGADGRLLLVWERYPRAGDSPRGLGFVHSTRQSRNLSEPAVVPGTADRELGINGSLQGQLMQKVAAAPGSPRIAVINSRFREDDASTIRLLSGRLSDR